MANDVGALVSVPGIARWFVRTWPRRIAIAMVVVLLLVIAAVGGFARVPPEPVRQVAAGEVVDLGPYTVSVESFFVSDQVDVYGLPEEADAWIGVVMELENTQLDGLFVDYQNFTLDGAQLVEARSTTVLLLADDSRASFLSPNLPVRVAMLWSVVDPDTIGDEVRLSLIETYEDTSFLFEETSWYVGDRIGVVEVPRDDDIPPAIVDEEP
ncbi:hypothetical protein EXU48_15925 [Occultella glacieicola]|uniref:DUF4352 domain-containing protein n=1 Tax=Occultella glacieicola TaxID=2518684 RepID=A0ABY2E0Z8_9MICO|nr:hypothetical protein [Occultella glacieicola]TDE91629.1 hypothetical protein EXU48_15925 [Occultella glacieicola]